MRYFPNNSLRLGIAITVVVLVSSWRPGSILNPTLHAQNPSSPLANVSEASSAKVGTSSAARLSSEYGKLPISFEVNQGQTDGSVQFLARGAGYTLFLTPGEAVLSLHANSDKHSRLGVKETTGPSSPQLNSTAPPSTVRLQLVGSNTKAEVAGVDALPGKSNYFVGNDTAKWHTDVPTYAKVRYSNVYPGIDLMYYGNHQGRLEHDFVVAPGADPNVIAIGLGGGDGAVPDQEGGLTLHTKTGDLTLRSPTVYQTIGGERKTIPASYLLADNQIKFQLGSYDRNATLIIDPVLVYAGIFGGSGGEFVSAVAADSGGNTYLTGSTDSTDFPVHNAVQSTWSGVGGGTGVFVAKVSADGSQLLFSTYLGTPGSNSSGNGIAVDSQGRVYVTGATGDGFPVNNAYQSSFGGGRDAFLTVFNVNGDTLAFSTYLGGVGFDSGNAVSLDSVGSIYIGGTCTEGFPTLHSILTSGSTFVAKFDKTGALQFSSIVGNVNSPVDSIAVDAKGSAYIAGVTGLFPTTKHAFQPTNPAKVFPFLSAYVAKLDPSGSSMVYATFLGGTDSVRLASSRVAIAIDSDGQAYVAGSAGRGFPVTANAFQKTYGGGLQDAFVAKLNAAGSGLIWSTYFGGSGDEYVYDLALDRYRTVYITGETNSSNLPLKSPIAGYRHQAGLYQDFVTTLNGSLSGLVYFSTYFNHGQPIELGPRIALDPALNIYLAGSDAETIQTTPGAVAEYPRVIGWNAYITKLVIMDDLALGISGSASAVAHGGNLTYTIAVTSKGPDFGSNVHIDDPLPAGTTFVAYNAGGGTCTSPPVGASGILHCSLPKLEKGATYSVTLTVKVNAVAGTTISNTATTVSGMQDFVAGNNTGTLTTMVN